MIKMMNELKVEYPTLELTQAKLRSVQSTKSRLSKQKERPDYTLLMNNTLMLEQQLKELVKYYQEPKLTITTMSKEQLEQLTYDETVKAIKSIQSKKCLSQHDTDKTEYNKALEIEEILLAHRNNNKPLNDNVVSKMSIIELVELIKLQDKKLVTKDFIIEQLERLL